MGTLEACVQQGVASSSCLSGLLSVNLKATNATIGSGYFSLRRTMRTKCTQQPINMCSIKEVILI